MYSNWNHSTPADSKKLNRQLLTVLSFLAFVSIPLLLLLISCSNNPKKNKDIIVPNKDSVSIKIIFTGDLMGHMPWINSGLKNGEYHYDTTYTFIKPYIEQADYAILNLETTLDGPPYQIGRASCRERV